MAQTSRPCKGCGALIYRTAPVAPIRRYCSPDCRPRCSVDECEEPAHSKGWCGVHYARVRKYGDPHVRLRQANVGDCSIEGCGQPSRKRGWCAAHYAQWHATGEARPFRYKWADRGACNECGAPCEDYGRRTYCSAACVQRARYWRMRTRPSGVDSSTTASKPERPAFVNCVACGVELSLMDRGKAGRLRRADTKLCKRCRNARCKHDISVAELIARDGMDCGICGDPVDPALVKPDPLSPSIDHVLPRSSGGTNDPVNLQLAHLHCNQVKQARVGFTMTT